MIDAGQVTLGVLAGGRGRRHGGADKAWLRHRGRTLLEGCLAAWPQPFAARFVVARAADPRHDALDVQAVFDHRDDFQGPVAGLEALAQACTTPWLLTVPVDLHDIPSGFADTLWRARGVHGAVAADVDGLQPLLALWPAPALRDAVTPFLDAGERAAHALVARLAPARVDITPARFANLNTPDSLHD